LLPALADFTPIFTNNIIKILLDVDSNRLLSGLQGEACLALAQRRVDVFVFHNSRLASAEPLAVRKKTFSTK
jgi:hypothetical protein